MVCEGRQGSIVSFVENVNDGRLSVLTGPLLTARFEYLIPCSMRQMFSMAKNDGMIGEPMLQAFAQLLSEKYIYIYIYTYIHTYERMSHGSLAPIVLLHLPDVGLTFLSFIEVSLDMSATLILS